MHASGYLGTPTRSPISFGLAFALTGAGLTALLLVPPIIGEQLVDNWTKIEPIPISVPPKPLPLKPTVDRREPKPQPAGPTPDAGHAFVEGDARGLNIHTKFPPIELTGAGETIIELDPPTPPVLVDASPDLRFAADRQPPYPPALQRMEVEGVVTVRVQIGTDGRVMRIEGVRSDHEAFLNATRSWGVRHWRFRPATRDGVPVVSWKTLSVQFRMNR